MQPVVDDFFEDGSPPSGPSSIHLNPFVRAYLDAVREYLLDLHDDGVPSRRVNEEHADLMDRLVRKLFRLAEDRYFENFPKLDFRLAVVAVGGYGRRELSLGSDIDLLFVYPGKVNPYIETLTEAISVRLWDARLVVGGATRTIGECMKVGREDLPTLTSYLDARFLIGDPGLFTDLDQEVRAYLKAHGRDFVRAKLAEQQRRHESFGESLYLLQPNLRESVGGLRDYHTALWTARAAQWEVRRAEHLLLHGFVDQDELEELTVALDFLWRVRNELHRGGRKDDRLHFEAQDRLAAYLGYQGSEGAFPIEEFMRSYYIHARALDRVSRRVTEQAQSILRGRGRGRRRAMHSVSEGLAIVEDKLEIPQASLLEERPLRLLAAFAIAQHHDVELSARAQRLIRQHIHLVDDVFREDPEAADLFRRILGSPTRVYRSLQLMDELGLLGAYLPEFGRLVGMWQQDMYHTYTVDVHSLFLVEQLRRLRKGRFRDELPLATGLMREVRSPEVLFLACMVHDIGKGLGGGHSEKGARMVPALAKRLGLEDGEKELVEFIVRHHLTMSAMAEQRDVQDSAVILRLANLCGTRERLRSLFLSTIADIRSVSPEAWTRWKGGLLESLYRNTAEWLEAGQAGEASEFFLERAIRRAAETRAGGLRALEESGEDRERVERFFDELPPRYWLDHEPAQVAAHVRAGLAFAATGADVRVHSFAPSQGHQFWGVIVLAPDRPGLFSTVAGVLTALGHNILAAQVYTTRSGMAMEIYQVDPIAGGRDEELLEVERIEVRLRRALEGAEQPHPERPRQAAPRLVRAQPPSVRITNDESDFYSIVDVATHDRPALLHDLTRTLHSLGLEIVMSRAATRANRVTDAFYVTDDGHKIQGEERRAQIEARLHDVLRQSAG